MAARGDPDYAELSRYLAALALPNRLALLRKLQLPHTLSEIELPAVRPRGSLAADRVLSRQAVQEHLAQLVDVGLVDARQRERDGRVITEYVVNQARLFTVTEEFRRLSLIRALRSAGNATARRTEASPRSALPEGPALVLASGPFEGQAFALDGAGPWTLGRDRACDIALEFDPFISRESAVVRRSLDGFALEVRPSARNGALLNFGRLEVGSAVRLRSGDLVSVGRSLLVMRGG